MYLGLDSSLLSFLRISNKSFEISPPLPNWYPPMFFTLRLGFVCCDKSFLNFSVFEVGFPTPFLTIISTPGPN